MSKFYVYLITFFLQITSQMPSPNQDNATLICGYERLVFHFSKLFNNNISHISLIHVWVLNVFHKTLRASLNFALYGTLFKSNNFLLMTSFDILLWTQCLTACLFHWCRLLLLHKAQHIKISMGVGELKAVEILENTWV